MHDNIKNALSTMQQEKEYNTKQSSIKKSIWIPQFKIGNKKDQSDLRSEEQIKNFKVKEGEQNDPPIFV